MIDVKKTSVIIPVDNLVKLKEIAVRKGTTQNSVINEFIIEGIESTEINKIQEPKVKFKDLAGKYSADKPFDAVEDIKKMRNKEALG
jgi:hypothetical protein